MSVTRGNLGLTKGGSGYDLDRDVEAIDEAITTLQGGTSQLVTVPSGPEPTFDFSAGKRQVTILTGDVSPTFQGSSAGDRVQVILCQDETGNRTVLWPANVNLADWASPVQAGPEAGWITVLNFVVDEAGVYQFLDGVGGYLPRMSAYLV
jgi:hypothetical protein